MEIKINGNVNKIIAPAIQGTEEIQKYMEDLIVKLLAHNDNNETAGTAGTAGKEGEIDNERDTI